jgi:hypothetical protein
VAVVQYTFTHKQYTERHITIHRTTQKFWKIQILICLFLNCLWVNALKLSGRDSLFPCQIRSGYILNTGQIRLLLRHSVRFNLSLKIPITCFYLCHSRVGTMRVWTSGRLQLKCDGTWWSTGEVKGKMANGVGSQYSSYYLGTWCIQHCCRRCSHLGCQ